MTMKPHATASLDADRPSTDAIVRLPYEAPELVDQGDVNEQTKSTTNTGADGPYS